MPRRTRLLSTLPLLTSLTGCPGLPSEIVSCEGEGTCETTTSSSSSGETPTTSDGGQTGTDPSTGDDTETDTSSGTTALPDDETSGSTTEPALPPAIVNGVVIPDFIDDNGYLDVFVSTEHADGVQMLLDSGELIELTLIGPGEFAGKIKVFTGLDNGKHVALLTPSRGVLKGEPHEAHYVVGLPTPGEEIGWHADVLDVKGSVAAIDVLPDGRPIELGTEQTMGEPRCYLRLRDKQGKLLEGPVPVLGSAYCRAIDLKIDRETGRMRVLVERENAGDMVWWAGEISAWGKGVKNIGIGAVGDTALALAARSDVVAVCGSRAVGTVDKLDALAVLLRPNELAETRLFDYRPSGDPKLTHQYGETARDCSFANDTLVLVGEARGPHVNENNLYRDRLMVIESDIASSEPAWTVAGIDLGVQTRALALDLDGEGRYHLTGTSCFDTCEPLGELWTYMPGGKLVDHTSIGPLGSAWFGPHDVAWSPAGYVVVALGELQGKQFLFKVQAFAPGVPLPLWTFLPDDKQGLQLALALAIGQYGEVYAGGIGAAEHPAFARIGG